jgi:hypothetical protein
MKKGVRAKKKEKKRGSGKKAGKKGVRAKY